MKINVLVSGGVDSSVALHLLKQQGHDVTAFYLKIWLEDELAFLGECPWEEDLQYVRAVCEGLGVPLEIVPMQKEYFEHVVAYTIEEVRNGRTPNPDVFCNTFVKFGFFMKKVPEGYDKIATGHYAQLEEVDGVTYLKKAPDPVKDQTYFLANLSQEQLQKCMFPIGHLSKAEVRRLAEEFDLPNKARKDSQGICFLGKLEFSEFIGHYLGEKPGDIVNFDTGEKLGEHKGFWYYTLGQRRDIRLSGGPWYVVRKDPVANVVYVSNNYFADDKPRREFVIGSLNFFAGKLPAASDEAGNGLQVKVRHGEKLHDCSIESLEGGRARVTLAEDDQGLAPGQFAVFYQGELCLGCGVIEG